MQSRLQYASLFRPEGTRTLPKLSWNLPVKDSLQNGRHLLLSLLEDVICASHAEVEVTPP